MSFQKFVIADLHLGHFNMAKKRGFSSIEEHDEFIISKWNSKVSKKDTVYILGDLTMEKSTFYPILDRLNGTKKVILGNHDKPQHIPELLKYVSSVCSSIQEKGTILTHIPIHESELHRFRKNIHGHIHENLILKPFKFLGFTLFNRVDKRYICVSCEQINYTPVSFKELGLIK